MNLKTLTFGTLAASTVIFASTVVAPAQAATVTGTLNFAKDGNVANITSSQIDFNNTADFFSVGNTSTGTFAGLQGNGITILNDLTLPFSSAFDFLQVNGGPTFRITGLSNSSFQNPSGSNFSLFSANVLGNFIDAGDITPGQSNSFIVTAQSDFGKFTNVSINSSVPAPVPTPALLPGLVGMGIAALRKRKSEELESVDA
jgi:hypothetical protein